MQLSILYVAKALYAALTVPCHNDLRKALRKMRDVWTTSETFGIRALQVLLLLGVVSLVLFNGGCTGVAGSSSTSSKPPSPSVDTTPPSVSITSPVGGATVSATITVTASASDSVGISAVQFLLDGANLGSRVTSPTYSISWNTTQVSNGVHTLAAKAWDQAGNTSTSSNVAVTVSQSGAPPPGPTSPPPPGSTSPPPPAGDDITISDNSGLGQTNRPVSISRPFVPGEIANFAQASIDNTQLPTQCDVKNRWPDGSLKFAIVSFVIPSIPPSGSVVVSFSNQGSGNNTCFLTKSDMLAAGYNFDGQIQLMGNNSHSISARSILNAASSCADATGGDPDGVLSTNGNLCSYWLKGPVVTAVILEDRNGRSFDVNTDGNAGNPLHPRFEAWFYPQNNAVQLGYTLEDTWASTNPTNSARDQTYSLVLTGGNISPVNEFTNALFTMTTRTMWHKTFCVNGATSGSANDCLGTSMHIDNNWPYWAKTKVLPHWDPELKIAPAKIASEWANLFSTGADPRCAPNSACAPGAAGINLSGCDNCELGPDGGIAYYPFNLGAAGAAEYHGPLPTWDIIYLLSQCDAANSTTAACGNGGGGDMRSVMLTNADLSGRIPYWYREADSNAGHGQTFDNSGVVGNVQTLGRVISINARTQVTLRDVTTESCNTDYSSDWINFGGTGQDVGGWGTGNLDMSHWPETAFASYLSTGQYHYYEQEMMQGAYALAGSPGTTGCDSLNDPYFNSRRGSRGYWGLDQERANDWQGRTNLLAASNAVDGSPEKLYFTDKLLRNVALWEGEKGIPFDMTGPAYLSADWSYGNTVRVNNNNAKPGPRGIWTWGPNPGYMNQNNNPICGPAASGCTVPGYANAHFQNAYSGFVAAWIDELGFCPHTNGGCQFLNFIAPFYFNQALNPEADIHQFDDYTFPVADPSLVPLTSWTWNGNLAKYYVLTGGVPTKTSTWDFNKGKCSGTMDENYPAESMAVMSFLHPLTVGGYSGATAYDTFRQSYGVANGCINGPVSFATSSPKWDVTPR